MADDSRRKPSSVSPDFEFEGDRPWIEDFGSTAKYRPGTVVYLQIPGQPGRDGPFKVESVCGPQKYKLCDMRGRTARNGDEIDEKYLSQ
ncbi:hypothetical protein F4775DRAFT_332616 [Biscogniauxia sp. FL1348]|nr:hypothetical protein F4775DRAFT_332616 [Biscogniauxia sp. FL1348]